MRGMGETEKGAGEWDRLVRGIHNGQLEPLPFDRLSAAEAVALTMGIAARNNLERETINAH